MDNAVSDFMKLWTQGDPDSEHKFKIVLLDGLDEVVQEPSDVLARIKVDEPIASPVLRWLKGSDYPSTIAAKLIGDSLAFS